MSETITVSRQVWKREEQCKLIHKNSSLFIEKQQQQGLHVSLAFHHNTTIAHGLQLK